MARLSSVQINKRFEAAKTRQQNWHSTWRSAYRFALPQRDVLDGKDQNQGQVKGDHVFDSTGMAALAYFADFFVSEFFPPMQDHIVFEPGSYFDEGQPGEDGKEEAEKLLAKATKIHRDAIEASEFDTEIGSYALELGIGTANMLIEKGTIHNPYNFVAVPTPHVFLERGPWGGVGGHFMQHKVEIGLIKEQWPDVDLPQDLIAQAREEPSTEVEVRSYTYWDKPAAQWCYDLSIPDREDRLLKQPRIYKRRSPWITQRWTVAPFETYGRGPAIFALPDIKTANKVVELILKNASFDIAGVYTGVDDGVLNPNTAVMVPGAIIPVARNHGHPQGASLAPLERSAKFDVAQLVLDDLRGAIKKLMFDDPMPPVDGQKRSATEFFMRKAADNLRRHGAFGRSMQELVRPIGYRGLDILDQLKLWRLPPGWEFSPRYIRVKLVSPFAQKLQMAEVENLMNLIELLQPLGLEVTAAGVVIEEVPQWIGKRLGVDPELLRGEQGKLIIMNLIAALMQASVQGQNGQAGAAGAAAVANEAGGQALGLGEGLTDQGAGEGLPSDVADLANIVSGADINPEGLGDGTEQ